MTNNQEQNPEEEYFITFYDMIYKYADRVEYFNSGQIANAGSPDEIIIRSNLNLEFKTSLYLSFDKVFKFSLNDQYYSSLPTYFQYDIDLMDILYRKLKVSKEFKDILEKNYNGNEDIKYENIEIMKEVLNFHLNTLKSKNAFQKDDNSLVENKKEYLKKILIDDKYASTVILFLDTYKIKSNFKNLNLILNMKISDINLTHENFIKFSAITKILSDKKIIKYGIIINENRLDYILHNLNSKIDIFLEKFLMKVFKFKPRKKEYEKEYEEDMKIF